MKINPSEWQQKCPQCETCLDLRQMFVGRIEESVRLRVDGDYTCFCTECRKPIKLELRFQPELTLRKVQQSMSAAG